MFTNEVEKFTEEEISQILTSCLMRKEELIELITHYEKSKIYDEKFAKDTIIEINKWLKNLNTAIEKLIKL